MDDTRLLDLVIRLREATGPTAGDALDKARGALEVLRQEVAALEAQVLVYEKTTMKRRKSEPIAWSILTDMSDVALRSLCE